MVQTLVDHSRLKGDPGKLRLDLISLFPAGLSVADRPKSKVASRDLGKSWSVVLLWWLPSSTQAHRLAAAICIRIAARKQ
jgi:hypothetical protein